MKLFKELKYWIWGFIFFHIILWTVLPILARHTLPMDALEGTIWARHLALGYDKNPFLNGWLTALALFISQHKVWSIYLFSQLSVGVCFWAVWKLAKEFLAEKHALISVFILELIPHYNLSAIDFDDNILELGLWALIGLSFYLAIYKLNRKAWIGMAIFGALGVMAKYYTVVLLLSLLGFLIFYAPMRQYFFNKFLYIALFVFLILIAPHFIWLSQHHWITLQYMFERVGSAHKAWLDHLYFPIKFLLPLLEVLLLPMLALLIFWRPNEKSNFLLKKNSNKNISSLQEEDYTSKNNSRAALMCRGGEVSVACNFSGDGGAPMLFKRKPTAFLGWLILGPIVITLLISALWGADLHSAWGLPLLSWVGILLLLIFKPVVTPKRLSVFIASIFVFMILLGAGYYFSLVYAGDSSSANYPGETMAQKLTKDWHSRYHHSLSYVMGQRWEAGNISFYSKDSPEVYMSIDTIKSFWIDENKLRRQGALFIWNEKDDPLPIDLKKRFPKLKDLHKEYFYWMRDKKATPIELWIAFLPPCFSSNCT